MTTVGSGRWHKLLLLAISSMLAFAACAEDEGPSPGGGGGEETIQSVDDLASGDVVGVQKGTTGESWAKENLPEGVEIRSFPEGPDAYTALEAGQLDAVINDEPTALAEVSERPSLEVAEKIDTGEAYGIAVNPENKELLDAVNAALGEIIADGTYDKIYSKYGDLPPGGSVADEGGGGGGTIPPSVDTLEEGILTVGSDIPYPPFEIRKGGKLGGLDIDLINEIASRLGVKTEVIDTSFDTIFTQLAGGRFDVVVAASTITPAREKQVNFSDPYYNAKQSLTVNTGG
jgi:ABC-type amino acid transport substrate-binding protein